MMYKQPTYGCSNENIYMKIPPGLSDELLTNGKLCKVRKALYGLRGAANGTRR